MSFHEISGIQGASEQADAGVCCLPRYSPDYNPVKQVFAKLKAMLRRTQAQTVDALWGTVGGLLKRFSSTECESCIHHWGLLCKSG